MASLVSTASLALAVLSIVPVAAQQPTPESSSLPPLTGIVVVNVSDSETGLPVRFAQVRLVPESAETDQASESQSAGASGAPTYKEVERPHLVGGFSELDGSVRLEGVPTGDYFVAALKPGYVPPGASTGFYATEEQLVELLASLPTVHIVTGQTATISLILHRGAVIAGRISFPDGSPAIGQKVSCAPVTDFRPRSELLDKTVSPQLQTVLSLNGFGEQRQETSTDDEGRYRIFGIPAGKCVVGTIISRNYRAANINWNDHHVARSSERLHAYPEMISVFAPGVFRWKDAKIFDIRGDEQITDVDLNIDPGDLHSLRGRILAGQDRHTPSGGMVLLEEEGAGLQNRFAELEDDGSFELHFLPPGRYTLGVIASDPITSDQVGSRQMYKTVKMAVVVGEHDVVLDDVMMMVLKPGEKDESLPF